ncbi:hypothetical protein E4U10_005256 [Claviceps purpurea]|nr:hypothetical protein E4U10_005256 [Claviceps purpurea]KAG6305663.1 hypothetical protein E4U45_008516 [Claviceps purpurea]
MVGLQIDQLQEDFQAPMKTYLTNGAIEKVGKIKKAEILTRGHKNPVHKTTFGKDGEEVRTAVSLKITAQNKKMTFTHHVYIDGTGTMRPGDVPM